MVPCTMTGTSGRALEYSTRLELGWGKHLRGEVPLGSFRGSPSTKGKLVATIAATFESRINATVSTSGRTSASLNPTASGHADPRAMVLSAYPSVIRRTCPVLTKDNRRLQQVSFQGSSDHQRGQHTVKTDS